METNRAVNLAPRMTRIDADNKEIPAGTPGSRADGIFAGPTHRQACRLSLKNPAPFSSQMTSRSTRRARKRWVIASPCKRACEGIGKTQRQLGLPKREPAEFI